MTKHLTLLLAAALLFAFTACSKNNQSADPLADLANIPSPVCQYSPEEGLLVCPQKDFDNITKSLNKPNPFGRTTAPIIYRLGLGVGADNNDLQHRYSIYFLHPFDQPYTCTLHLINNKYGVFDKGTEDERTSYYICREDFDKILENTDNFDPEEDPAEYSDNITFPTELSSGFYQNIADETPQKHFPNVYLANQGIATEKTKIKPVDPWADLTNIPSPVCQYSPTTKALMCPQKDFDNITKTFNRSFKAGSPPIINIVGTLRKEGKARYLYEFNQPYICTLHLIGNRYGLTGFAGKEKTEYYICREDFDRILKDGTFILEKDNPELETINRFLQKVKIKGWDDKKYGYYDRDYMEFPTELSSGFYQPITDKTPKRYVNARNVGFKQIMPN